MLKLKIENFDKLPNGGPLEHVVERRGFEFGRDQHLDWTLPDKTRVVSGKHCEIRFYDDAYWLLDFSTNGTFVNNSSKRVQSPYKLAHGDMLSVGEYVLSVNIRLPSQPSTTAPMSAAPAATPGIWETSGAAPAPIDARDLLLRNPEAERAADVLYQAAYVPPVVDEAPVRKPQPAATPANNVDPWGAKSVVSAPPPEAPAVAPPPAAPAPAPTPVTAPRHDGDGRDFIRRFAKGAGLPDDSFGKMTAGELAEHSGHMLNLMCLHLMALLRARAEAKSLSRSGNRTLIQSTDNNPLKFMPTPEEALRIMLGPKVQGYLDARQTIDSTFADLKLHQISMLGAMQAAAAQLFEDLSPDAIAKASETKRSLLSTGKGKQWDAFTEMWTAKAGTREHGMLGAFLDLFVEHYDKLSKNKP